MIYEHLHNQLQRAEEYESQANYEEAARLAQEILSSLSSPGVANEDTTESTILQSRATRLLGTVCWRRGDNLQALEHFHASLILSQHMDDQEGIAKVLGNIGTVHWALSDYPKALEFLSNALSVDEALGNTKGIAIHVGNIGNVYADLADYPRALEYYGRALDLEKSLGNTKGVALWLGNIGTVYKDIAEYPQALEYMRQALSIDQELGNKSGEARHLGNIGIVYMNLSDFPKALEYYTMALSKAEELGIKGVVTLHLGNIGIVYAELSDFPKALEYYAKALAIAENIGDKAREAAWLGTIGNVFARLKEYSQALEYLVKALNLDEEIGNKRGVARHLGNIGIVHKEQSDYATALEYYLKALHIAEEVGNKREASQHLGNIGTVFTKLADYTKAHESYQRALQKQEELGNRGDANHTLASLGALYALSTNPEHDDAKAEIFLRKAIAQSQELGTKLYDAHKTLAQLYERQERWRDANQEWKNYYELKDHVQSEEAQRSAALMEQKKQVAEREKEIAIAKAAADAQMSATTTLLYKVLPPTIANRLINGERVADYFRDVSILFADIVGFTPIASRMPAKAVLTFLNYVFGEFDRLCERHGCEKIKTIGDGYLAVAGAPVPCEDHAERVSMLAFELMDEIVLPDDIRSTLPGGVQFNLRIGIHTGPCFGGIVGENRFVYDIYSDAVNLAARMESHGEPGKIHVSDEFCFHLQNRMDTTGNDLGGVRFVERDEMHIKGKGLMRTYFLERV